MATALYDHCVKVYEHMTEHAAPDPETPTQQIYEGFTTKIFTKLGLSAPYYTGVMNKLMAMGCIEQVHRGGGGKPSTWLLYYPPNEEAFASSRDKVRGKATARDTQDQFVKDVLSRFAEMERRLQVLEAQNAR